MRGVEIEADDAVDGSRFERATLLGVGAYGSVYRAWDRRRRAEVALKVLHDVGSEASAYLKREFRALSAIAHPNVIELDDLVVTQERAFFTMEYLDAEPFSFDGAAGESARLGRILQAVRGLRSIHASGYVHRDLKPPNVLVARDGRVVLLDCGLASRIPRGAGRASDPVGSPPFMAPEIWLGASPSTAQDVYALAVMIHEALTGQPVFADESFESSQSARQRGEFRALTAADGVPAAVADALNRALLPDAAARPTLDELEAVIVERIGTRTRARPAAHGTPMIGREAERAVLEALLEGRAASPGVVVVGEVGVGKTRLVDEVLARLPEEALLLRSRCHPHEALLLPALDGVIDPICELLEGWTAGELRPVRALDGALGRVFPSLAGYVQSLAAQGDPLEERLRAAQALGALFAALARRAPLVIAIDDAQWGDGGSWSMLRDALAAGVGDTRLIIATRRALPELGEALQTLRLDPLDPAQSRALFDAVSRRDARASRFAEANALAEGNPMALIALAEHGDELARRGRDGAWLVDALEHRLDGASEASRDALLAVVAAGEPTPVSLIAEGDGASLAFEALRRRRLIDFDTGAPEELVGLAQGWVREAVLQTAPPEVLRAQHARLAERMIRAEVPPERAVPHLRACGDQARLRELARAAGERAERRLDFARAAELFEIAVRDGRDDDIGLARSLAENLRRAGRGRRAGEHFEALAARVSDPAEAEELTRRAAEQFLYAGEHERGVAIVRRSLARRGVGLITNPALAFAQTFMRHRALRRRGTHYDGPGDSADPLVRARIDAMHNAALGLSMSEPMSSVAMQASSLLLAATQGTRAQYVQSIGAFIVQNAGYADDPAATAARVASVEPMLGEVDASAAGFFALAVSGAAWVEGRNTEALSWAERAAEHLVDRTRIDQWSIDSLQIVRASALSALGRYAALRELVRDALADARAREDLYLESNVCVRFAPRVHLLDDRADLALRALERGRAAWLGERYGLLDFFSTLERVEVALYQGDLDGAERTLRDGLRAARRALMLTIHFHRTLSDELRGRVALAIAARRADRRALSEARACARRLDLGSSPHAHASATLLRAGCLQLEGDPRAARHAYALARDSFEALGVIHRAAAASLGADDASDSLDRLRALGFACPERIASSLAPVALAT